MKLSFVFLLVSFLGLVCLGQSKKKHTAGSVDPYINMPFKPGDIKTLNLCIPIGKIIINCTIKYTLLDDPDGMFYSFNHRFKAEINKAMLTGINKSKIPQEITNGFSNRIVELTEKEIERTAIRTTSMYYWFTVQDFNLDGKPDFAFIGDLGYHSSPVNNYVWVNMDDKLVYWYGLSGVASDNEDSTKRIVSILSPIGNGHITPEYYKIEKDTFLVPVKIKE